MFDACLIVPGRAGNGQVPRVAFEVIQESCSPAGRPDCNSSRMQSRYPVVRELAKNQLHLTEVLAPERVSQMIPGKLLGLSSASA